MIINCPNLSDSGPLVLNWPVRTIEEHAPWPFSPTDSPSLASWRTLPADSIHGVDRQHLLATLRQISVLNGDEDLRAALRGDVDGAIGAALGAMPVREITLQVDILMTSLLSAALNRNAAACLFLAQVIGLTDLDHPLSTAIAGSWLSYGMRHSTNPDKFSEAAAILWQELGKRKDAGDKAAPQVNEATSPLTEPRA